VSYTNSKRKKTKITKRDMGFREKEKKGKSASKLLLRRGILLFKGTGIPGLKAENKVEGRPKRQLSNQG